MVYLPEDLRRRLVVIWIFALLVYVGLPAASAAAPSLEYVYVAARSGDIYGFSLRRDGVLVPLPAPHDRTHVTEYPISIVTHPAGRFLYAATVNDQSHKGTIYSYRILGDGALAPAGRSIAVTPSIGQLTIDPTGRFLYAVVEDNDRQTSPYDSPPPESLNAYVYRIGQKGTLRQLPRTLDAGTFELGQQTGFQTGCSLVFSPNGMRAYLYAYQMMIDVVPSSLNEFRVGNRGSLIDEPRNDKLFGDDGPRTTVTGSPTFAPHTPFAFLEEADGRIRIVRVDRRGELQAVKKTRYLSAPEREGLYIVTVDPLGRFVYVVERDSDSRLGKHDVYRILPSGAMKLCSENWFLGGIVADPTGRFLISADDGEISVYAVTDGGQIRPKPLSSQTVPAAIDNVVFARR